MSKENNIGELNDVERRCKSSLYIQEAHVQNTEVVTPNKGLSTFDIDCLDEIFEWLTLTDLLSISQTCKRLQWAAGDFFRRNYSALQVQATSNGVYVLYNNKNI